MQQIRAWDDGVEELSNRLWAVCQWVEGVEMFSRERTVFPLEEAPPIPTTSVFTTICGFARALSLAVDTYFARGFFSTEIVIFNRRRIEQQNGIEHATHNTMSEPINANPTVLDANALPTRQPDKLEPALSSQLQGLLSLAIADATTDDDAGSVAPSLVSDDEQEDPFDAQEIFDLIAHISDPEHPLTLGQLAVVNLADIKVLDSGNKDEMGEVLIKITPTITHCSLATLIGLGIRVRLERCLPVRFRITILLKEGSHQSENQVNKQLNDKERVAAACENDQLLNVISKMLATCK